VMKTLARISGITAALSICSLGSRGSAMWVALATGAVAMAVLFVSCGKLGYFGSPAREAHEADVVSLEERRMVSRHARCQERDVPAAGRAALRGR
ncbi:MAG: hypothetical protein ACYC99_05020, partial [Candidatus Geothermincolia bacterium]